MKLYTKTGDKGTSSIIGVARIPKDADVFHVVGTIDELNSWVGLSIASLHEYRQIQLDLMRIQDKLLITGAVIAQSKKVKLEESELKWLEQEIDRYQKVFGENFYTKFLLPGGVEPAARVDVARTVCRRLERIIVDYCEDTAEFSIVLQYINRLSDYLFALRCYLNHEMKYNEKEFTPTYLKVFEK